MSVTVDGIFSGLDTTAIVEALVNAQSGQRNSMQAQLERERANVGAITDINRRLSALAEASQALQNLNTSGYTATAPEAAGFTAEAGSGAIAGTYTVDVTSLATNDMEVSQGFAAQSASGTVAQGTMDVTVGGVTTTITIDGTNDSLRAVALELDELDGVQAYILNNGDATNPYQLVVQSESTGADNALTIDTAGLTGAGTVPTFTEAQAGADAVLTINNLAITSSSNTVTAIPGLTIDLTEDGLGPQTVTVDIDKETIETALTEFKDAYNAVVDYYTVNNTFDQATGTPGTLFGDSTVRRVVDRIGSLVSAGYNGTGSSLSILAQVGIETTQNGTLNFDSVDLDTAIDADFEGVIEFLTSDSGALAALTTEIEDVFVDSVDGILASRKTSLERSIRDLEDRISDEDLRLDAQAQLLRDRFTRLETTLAELQSATQFVSNLFPPQSSSSS